MGKSLAQRTQRARRELRRVEPRAEGAEDATVKEEEPRAEGAEDATVKEEEPRAKGAKDATESRERRVSRSECNEN